MKDGADSTGQGGAETDRAEDDAVAAHPAIATYLRGETSAALTVAELLLSTEDVAGASALLAAVEPSRLAPAAQARYTELLALFERHRRECETIVGMLRVDACADPADSPQARVRACRRWFDALVARSEEASVALYSLGDPALLDQATAEVVNRIRALGLLGPSRRILQIGCGIGRFEAALAADVAEAHGIDISPNMVQAARRRCAGLDNVHIRRSSGSDLAGYADASLALVYAVDSMPYVVEAGAPIATSYFREAARVLEPGGAFLIYNFSYRGDPPRDAADVRHHAADAGLTVERCDETPFSFWNGREYLLRKPSA